MINLIIFALFASVISFSLSFITYKLLAKAFGSINSRRLNLNIINPLLFSILNAPVLSMMGGHSAYLFPSPLGFSLALDFTAPHDLYYRFFGGLVSFIITLIIAYIVMKEDKIESEI